MLKRKIEGEKMLRVIELFSGVGTQRMALRNLGIDHEVVAMCEIDPYAIQSYEAIHGETKNLGDITQVDATTLPDFDLLTYSFPCQSLSSAGKQEGLIRGKTRSGLLYECEKIIETKRPKYLLLENVKNLVGDKFRPAFDEWLDYLERLGYTNYWKVLNAKDYGMPQSRERVFVVSILGEHKPYNFPQPIPLTTCVNDYKEINAPHRKVTSSLVPYFDSSYHQPQTSPNGMVKLFDGVKQGYFKNGFTAYRIYSVFGCCPTLTTISGSPNFYELGGSLTPLERWRLMGISDEDFYLAKGTGVSETQLIKQAGNAIVVNVLEAIFKQLFI